MSFDHFLESLENVPPELERNFTLINQLDKRTSDSIQKINDYMREYRNTRKRKERLAIRQKIYESFDKMISFADDKIELSHQVYELIDKHIKRLTSIGQVRASEDDQATPPGFDMPLDPHEPKYCICRTVSHGEMIACDNKECPIEWFHYACVNLKAAPKGKWFCGQCYNSSRSSKQNRARFRARY